MKEIKLTQNQVALVDDEIFEYLSQWKWYAGRNRKKMYAVRSQRLGIVGEKKKVKTISMHRVILEFYGYDLKNKEVDHINSNPLDNRLENLRACTAGENQHNAGIRKDNVSGFKGVSWAVPTKKWKANIRFESSLIHLGYFESPEAAGFAYNVAASMLHREFAYYNSITITNQSSTDSKAKAQELTL